MRCSRVTTMAGATLIHADAAPRDSASRAYFAAPRLLSPRFCARAASLRADAADKSLLPPVFAPLIILLPHCHGAA